MRGPSWATETPLSSPGLHWAIQGAPRGGGRLGSSLETKPVFSARTVASSTIVAHRSLLMFSWLVSVPSTRVHLPTSGMNMTSPRLQRSDCCTLGVHCAKLTNPSILPSALSDSYSDSFISSITIPPCRCKLSSRATLLFSVLNIFSLKP